MTNFDELFKTVKDAGELVAKKAADEGKKAKVKINLNASIMNEKKKVASLYEEIGRRYYECHKDAESDPELEVMESITAALSAIEDYKKQLDAIKKEDKEV